MNTTIRIVADSSADTLTLEGVSFAFAPLKIITQSKEYVDDNTLDVAGMVSELQAYSGKSSTACPSVGDWLAAFGDAQQVFCITITSGLSGSCNAACIAAQDYEERYPGRRVFVLDSLSAGPELRLLLERLRDYVQAGMAFDEVVENMKAYARTTGLIFMLQSMRNLANNGRVSPLVAKAAGLLGIRAVGKASDKGQLELLEKSRGQAKALAAILNTMEKQGYRGGKVRISHVDNAVAVEQLSVMLMLRYPQADIESYPARGLCSFYAEQGGLLLGFEKEEI